MRPPPATDTIVDRFVSDVERLTAAQTIRLSPRELEALRLAADGLSMPEIAESTGRATETVKTQLARARSKLGARNVAHAVALAFRAGLVD